MKLASGAEMAPLDGAASGLTAVDGAMARTFLPRRPRSSHKGDYGRVYILGGSLGYTGAPVLAARGALRGGAGLVFLGVGQAAYPIVAGHCLCAMPSPLPADELGRLTEGATQPILAALAGKSAALIGPGLGTSPQTQAVIRKAVAAAQCPLVVDADGINALAGHIDSLDARTAPTVLTPHDGELARLLGHAPDDRLTAGRVFAREHRCVLVLKGYRTLTIAPDGRTWVNTTGNPGMASGGSGDVLAGLILALLGQGFPPERAAYAAVYLHGRAGDLAAARLGEYAMTPVDLLDALPEAMREIS